MHVALMHWENGNMRVGIHRAQNVPWMERNNDRPGKFQAELGTSKQKFQAELLFHPEGEQRRERLCPYARGAAPEQGGGLPIFVGM